MESFSKEFLQYENDAIDLEKYEVVHLVENTEHFDLLIKIYSTKEILIPTKIRIMKRVPYFKNILDSERFRDLPAIGPHKVVPIELGNLSSDIIITYLKFKHSRLQGKTDDTISFTSENVTGLLVLSSFLTDEKIKNAAVTFLNNNMNPDMHQTVIKQLFDGYPPDATLEAVLNDYANSFLNDENSDYIDAYQAQLRCMFKGDGFKDKRLEPVLSALSDKFLKIPGIPVKLPRKIPPKPNCNKCFGNGVPNIFKTLYANHIKCLEYVVLTQKEKVNSKVCELSEAEQCEHVNLYFSAQKRYKTLESLLKDDQVIKRLWSATPLYRATRLGNDPNIVKILLENGAIPDIINDADNLTPFTNVMRSFYDNQNQAHAQFEFWFLKIRANVIKLFLEYNAITPTVIPPGFLSKLREFPEIYQLFMRKHKEQHSVPE